MLSGSAASVLVVDDTPDRLELMEILLRQGGYHVFTARDGYEAFEVARRERPLLVISDVAMPNASGIELCRRLRADPELRAVPVLLVSALHVDDESAVEGLRAGADEYLEAPYNPMRLIAQVSRLVERARSEEVLRESEERYRILFQSSPQPMWVFDEETLRFLAVNEAAVHHYGYSREEFLAMTIKDIRPAEDVPALLDDVGMMSRGIDVSGTWRHRKKDGTLIAVDITSHELVFDDRPAKLVLAFDVSARKEAEEALRKSEEQLRQSHKLEAIGRLAGGVAHDFNNVLTAIMGYAELTLRRMGPDNPLSRNIEEIKRAAARAGSLTQQLLAFSRKQVLQPKVLDLNHIVDEMDRMLRRLIGEDIDLVTILEPGLGQVKADPGQIEQIMMNLAVNARDAMPRGGKLTIETKNVYLDRAYAQSHLSVRPGSYVMLAVSDTGEGMDAETRERIFEPFFTTKEKGKGTGLGLSMIYGIVKQSGGNIWVYSEPGRGTTFKIYLPQVAEGASAVPGLTAPEMTARGTETVLMVDDDDTLRELIEELLKLEGYTVLAARNGREALNLRDRHEGKIDLLITDVVMPELSGRELAERLTANCNEIKVLYMSGYTDDAVIRHGVLEEGASFLQKPFTPEALARKVRAVLDENRNGARACRGLKA
jgi:two-component system, cell cycle sensor histidine kinase and response regulator CckA